MKPDIMKHTRDSSEHVPITWFHVQPVFKCIVFEETCLFIFTYGQYLACGVFQNHTVKHESCKVLLYCSVGSENNLNCFQTGYNAVFFCQCYSSLTYLWRLISVKNVTFNNNRIYIVPNYINASTAGKKKKKRSANTIQKAKD